MRLAAAVLLALAASGCGDVIINPDLSAVVSPLDCRPFSACWAVDCPCERASLSSCLLCDPAKGLGCGDCSALVDAGPAQCIEQAQECVGRAPSVCPGLGARCLPAGMSCAASMSPSGDPPDQVPVAGGDPDAGPAIEPRCTFTDDVCCPGVMPIDLGVNISD